MNDTIQKTLLALKDVQGTLGSFVLDGEGALLAMEMPKMFDAGMFAELGPRIERLAESFSALGDELESCLVRFSDHLIYFKQFPKGGALCILTDSAVNLPALKMAVNLAHRKLAGEIATARPIGGRNGHPVAAEGSGLAIPQDAVAAVTPARALPSDAAAAGAAAGGATPEAPDRRADTNGAGEVAADEPSTEELPKQPSRTLRYYRGHLVED